MVRLKQIKYNNLIIEIECLNSTMVRLKLLKFWIDEQGELSSQFHYGSIKTNLGKELGDFSEMSQFHYGSIKTNFL